MDFLAKNITNLTDARYFSAYNAAWISFSFDTAKPEYIAPNVAAGIAGWLEGPSFTGSFGVQQLNPEIRKIAETLNLQAVMLSSRHDFSDLTDFPIIFEISIENANTASCFEFINENASLAKAFILNFDATTTWTAVFNSETIDFSLLRQATKTAKIYLNFNITADDLPIIAAELPDLQGIVLQGGEEEAVGIKSFDDLDDLIDFFTC